MSTSAPRSSGCARPHRQAGFTIIELSVAMVVALFLVGGLLTVLQNMRRAQGSQAQLGQLQDDQRVAMTLITDIVQAAGYFPDPTTNTAASALPSQAFGAKTFAASQAFLGTHDAASPGDEMSVRFVTASGENIINCVGGTNPASSGVQMTYINTFSVVNKQLVCSLNGAAAVPLVSNVENMQVLYGVKRDTTADNYSVDTYLTADQLTAADWLNISSVKVRLTFTNPLKRPQGDLKQPATIDFTRVIAVMARAGVKA